MKASCNPSGCQPTWSYAKVAARSRPRGPRSVATLFLTLLAIVSSIGAPPAAATDYRERLPQDEVVYFLLPDRFENGDPSNDRGGLAGGRLQTGFDPTDVHFYHGGDLAGVARRLDYLATLGVTALWLGPVFTNQTVQGPPGQESAGYHGYWITDFTRVDPHFGTNETFRKLVEAAHERGMKVYLDIVVNHTADVIKYRECPQGPCPYRARADYFHQAYTPYVPAGQESLKAPAWLNDTRLYHNRGDSTFTGESSTLGDFSGLDDLMTENPRVVRGFIDLYGDWLERFALDGFRIDTAKHVNPEFFQQFVPAMLARARKAGTRHFHLFAEVFSSDPAILAWHTRVAALPAVLDFGFAETVRKVTLGEVGTDALASLFALDALYSGGEATALQLPTFLSNHDQGRYGYFMLQRTPEISDSEAMQRTLLANAMLFTLRGIPVVYYGDEQGFAGSGGDTEARQDMFASKVEQFNSERRIGSERSPFSQQHPLYLQIQQLAALRASQPALRRGRQIVRASSAQPGLFAVSRLEPGSNRELLIAFNTSNSPVGARVQVNASDSQFVSLHGSCEPARQRDSYHVSLKPFAYVVCAATAAH